MFSSRFLVLALLYSVGAHAENECQGLVFKDYLSFRSAVLAINPSKKNILSYLSSELKNKYVSDMLEESIIGMRLQEAKILKITEFAEKCHEKGGLVVLKISYFDPKIDRAKIWFERVNNNYLVSGFAIASTATFLEYDKGLEYRPFETLPPQSKGQKP